MWIWLDKYGQVQQYLTHGSAAVSGETDFQIFAYFNGLNTEFFDYATIKLKRPDMDDSIYPSLSMKKVDLKYTYLPADGSSSKFTDGITYTGFWFDFSDFTQDEEVVILLDTPGLWEASITLFGSTNKMNASGLITFEVGDSTYEGLTELTLDQVLANLIFSLQAVSKSSTSFVKHIDNFASKAEDGELDENYATIGSVVYDDTSGYTYKILSITVNENDETKVSATYKIVQKPPVPKIDLSSNTMTFNQLKDLLLTDTENKCVCVIQSKVDNVYKEFIVEVTSSDITAYDIVDNVRYNCPFAIIGADNDFETLFSFQYTDKKKFALSDMNGQIIVPLTPVQDYHATSKKFVEDLVNAANFVSIEPTDYIIPEEDK